jgi:hypothetical protein
MQPDFGGPKNGWISSKLNSFVRRESLPALGAMILAKGCVSSPPQLKRATTHRT